MAVLTKVKYLRLSLRYIHKKKVLKTSKLALEHLNLDYRVKASTLMETLVATVLIVIVFMIASMILNNLFSNTIKSNTRSIDAHLNELRYLYNTKKLSLPYHDDYKQWDVSITSNKKGNQNIIVFEAINSNINQNILKEISAN